MDLGAWLQGQGRPDAKPLGFAFWASSPWSMAFATKQEVWYVPDVPAEQEPILRSILENALCNRAGPTLVTRELIPTFGALRRFLRLKERDAQRELVSHFVGCLTSLSYSSGRPVHRADHFTSAAEDAMDVCLTEPQLSIECPSYYKAVALPNARNAALGWTEPVGEQRRFQVTYSHLFLRVLGNFSGDPTLRRVLGEPDVDPIEALASKLSLERHEVVPFLTWVTLASDSEAFNYCIPMLGGELPQDLPFIQRTALDKVMPNIRRYVIEQEEICRDNRGAVSFYGRPSLYGLSPGVGLHHRVFGSVRDIIEVAKASLLNFSEVECVFETGGRWWERVAIVGYADCDPLIFAQQLEQVCCLGYPLGHPERGGTSLAPKVSID